MRIQRFEQFVGVWHLWDFVSAHLESAGQVNLAEKCWIDLLSQGGRVLRGQFGLGDHLLHLVQKIVIVSACLDFHLLEPVLRSKVVGPCAQRKP